MVTLILMLVAAVLLGACGSDAEEAVEGPIEDLAVEEPAQREAETPSTTAVSSMTQVQVFTQPEPGTEFEGRVRHRFPALGGVELWVGEDESVSYESEHILVFKEGEYDVVLGLVSATVNGAAIETVDDYLDEAAAVAGSSVEPLDESIELFGLEAEGYRFTGPEQTVVFSNNPIGFVPLFAFGPFPVAELFLVETASGVLHAGVEPKGDADPLLAREAMAELLATVRLTGESLDVPIDYGSADFEPTSPAPEPQPADFIDDGPDRLTTPFVPVEPGTYQLGMTGNLIELTVTADDWWVQPLFPGFVVFAEDMNPGPGVRDIVMMNDVNEIVSTSAGPGIVGEPQTFERIAELVDAPPPGLLLSGAEEIEVGGQVATRVDLLIDPDSPCSSAEPCAYSFVDGIGQPWAIKPGLMTRAWFFEDVEAPFVVFAGDSKPGWNDEAASFVSSFVFR